MGFLDFLPGIGDAVDAGISYLNNERTNKANKEIAQMNNDWSEKMLDKQNQYNIDQWNREAAYQTDMWNKTNEYNSLSAQRQRAEEAGFSPLAVLGGGMTTAASASSPSGKGVGLPSPSQTTMHAAPSTTFGRSLMQLMEYKMAKERNDAEVQQIQIDNQTRLRKNMAEITKLYGEIRGADARERLDRQLYQMQPQLWQSQMDLQRQQAENFRTNALLNTSERLLNSKALDLLPEQHRVDMAMKLAQTNLYSRSAKLTQQQFRTEIYRTLYESYHAAGLRDANHLANRMADDVVKNLSLQNQLMPYDKGGSIVNGLMNTVTQGIIGYGLFRGLGKVPPIKGFGR